GPREPAVECGRAWRWARPRGGHERGAAGAGRSAGAGPGTRASDRAGRGTRGRRRAHGDGGGRALQRGGRASGGAMSRSRRRRRGAVLLALAIACGGMAASEVQSRESRLELRIGPMVPVVVARADLPAGTSLGRGRLGRLLATRQVPARFAPADPLPAPEEAA